MPSILRTFEMKNGQRLELSYSYAESSGRSGHIDNWAEDEYYESEHTFTIDGDRIVKWPKGLEAIANKMYSAPASDTTITCEVLPDEFDEPDCEAV